MSTSDEQARGQEGYFGNPFRIAFNETRESSIEKYRRYFYERIKNDPVFIEWSIELKGKFGLFL